MIHRPADLVPLVAKAEADAAADLADAARQLRPGLKVLFITGYAENAVVRNGHLDKGMQMIAKPFEMDTLARRTREMLERP